MNEILRNCVFVSSNISFSILIQSGPAYYTPSILEQRIATLSSNRSRSTCSREKTRKSTCRSRSDDPEADHPQRTQMEASDPDSVVIVDAGAIPNDLVEEDDRESLWSVGDASASVDVRCRGGDPFSSPRSLNVSVGVQVVGFRAVVRCNCTTRLSDVE